MADLRVLLDEPTIAARVRELGRAIAERHPGEELVLVGVLRGSFVFLADLARAIENPVRVEFLAVQSYGESTKSSGVVQITMDLHAAIEGKHVIVVEDIVDTGLTMSYLLELLRARKPASLELAALLHKPARTVKAVPIDYLGFTIDDVFVVGFGLDHAGRYRNLPYVGVLEVG